MHELVEDLVELRPVDAARQQGRRALFAGEDVVQCEAGRVAVLEVGELLEEHHVLRRAVRVDEREARGRRGGEDGCREGHHRRDARAGGDPGEVGAVEVGEIRGERALRAHDLDAVARLQVLVGPHREQAAEVALDPDADAAGGGRTADRIAAAHFASVDVGTKGDVLAGQVVVVAVQLRRNGEGHLDALRGKRTHFGDLELVEPRSSARDGAHRQAHSTLKWSKGSRQARHS